MKQLKPQGFTYFNQTDSYSAAFSEPGSPKVINIETTELIAKKCRAIQFTNYILEDTLLISTEGNEITTPNQNIINQRLKQCLSILQKSDDDDKENQIQSLKKLYQDIQNIIKSTNTTTPPNKIVQRYFYLKYLCTPH